MNKKLFYLLYNIGKKNKKAEVFWKYIAKYSYPFFYAVYIAGFLITIIAAKGELAVYLIIPATVFLINNGLRKKLNKKRPFQELNIKPALKHGTSPSLPSNHAACAMVISLVFLNTAFLLNNALLTVCGFIFLITAVFTGISRIICGIHYPRDIALGFFIGIAGFFAENAIINIILKAISNF